MTGKHYYHMKKLHPMWDMYCVKHNVPFCWKSEIPELPKVVWGHVFKDVRVCPVCLKLARLEIRYLLHKYKHLSSVNRRFFFMLKPFYWET